MSALNLCILLSISAISFAFGGTLGSVSKKNRLSLLSNLGTVETFMSMRVFDSLDLRPYCKINKLNIPEYAKTTDEGKVLLFDKNVAKTSDKFINNLVKKYVEAISKDPSADLVDDKCDGKIYLPLLVLFNNPNDALIDSIVKIVKEKYENTTAILCPSFDMRSFLKNAKQSETSKVLLRADWKDTIRSFKIKYFTCVIQNLKTQFLDKSQ